MERKYSNTSLTFRGLVSFAFLALVTVCNAQEKDRFSFWYEQWKPETTLKKLERANVLVGVPATAVPEIRKSGRHALQYVTYYQGRFHTMFLKDMQDLPNVGFKVGDQFVKSTYGGENNYVLCPNSVELRNRALAQVSDNVKQGYDGYFIDNTFLDPPAHAVCTAPHQHLEKGVQGGKAYVELVSAISQKLKQQNPKAVVLVNPGNPAWISVLAPGKPSLWDIADYVLWEGYGFTLARGPQHDDWQHCLRVTRSLTPQMSAKVVALSYPVNVAEARLSFAVARIFGLQWTANLGEVDQNSAKAGGHFGVFMNDVPFEIGEPVGPLPDRGATLLHRTFTHGEIFANMGPATETISLRPGEVVLLGEAPAKKLNPDRIQLPPMTAAIVVNQ